ncbi:hypothetical protein C446_06780 [Halobiforma nitratireducens JCM 10879]|uniref:DUF4013 domain-containing protein n=1 Tax=Halobiforma nitratireducens JCM 10879 TaxID=1227454 RepID=M0M571_9EURY|nr:hypothetical protein C446_06780 [Halobiforma nitratireducens JCM 10879]
MGRFGDLLSFLAVPLFATLLEIDAVRRAVAGTGRGFSIEFKFQFPSPLLDLWSFTDPPEPATGPPSPGLDGDGGGIGDSPGSPPAGSASGPGGDTVTVDLPYRAESIPLEAIGPDLLGWLLALLVGYTVFYSVVYAIYLGGMDRRLRNEPVAVADCVRSYTGRFLVYFAVVFGVFLLAVPILIAQPMLVLLALPVALVAMYLFYGVPFLFVTADASVRQAFRRSYRLGVAGGAYLRFGLWHFATVLLVSPVISVAVTGGGAAGFLLGSVVALPLSLVLTATTVSFFDELVDRDPNAFDESSGTGDRIDR